MEDARAEEEVKVVEEGGEGRGGDVEIALEVELAGERRKKRRGDALGGEGVQALESGEERREEGVKELVVGPML